MKPRSIAKATPTAMEAKAEELSVLFAEAGWQPSEQNFKPRPFVKWEGEFFSAAGSPPGCSCRSTCRETAEGIIAFLNEAGAPPAPQREPFVILYENTERLEPAVHERQPAPDPTIIYRDSPETLAALAAANREIESLRSSVPEGGGRAEPDVKPEVGEDGIPEAFRGLMMDGESAEKFTERMRRRWLSLQQYRIDSAKGKADRALPDITDEELKELQDLEARNNVSKWLA